MALDGSVALPRLLDPSGGVDFVAFESGMAGAHYARFYEDWTLQNNKSIGVLAVGSRKDGMHFFGLVEQPHLGGAQALKQIASYSPRIGRLLLDGHGRFSTEKFSDLNIRFWAIAGGALYGAVLGLLLATVVFAFVKVVERIGKGLRPETSNVPGDANDIPSGHEHGNASRSAGHATAALKRQLLESRESSESETGPSWPAFWEHFKRRYVAGMVVAGALAFGGWGVVRAWDGVYVAFEGHAKSANALVAVSICQGSEQMKPWMIEGFPQAAWLPCFQTVDGAWTPVLFIFDTEDWSEPTPRYALPLYGWGAALHVQLVAMPSAANPTMEELFAVVSSGFSEGPLGALGAVGLGMGGAEIAALPIGTRPLGAAGGVTEPTSFQFQSDSGAPWTINVSAALDPKTQRSLTAPLNRGISFPEGVLTYQLGSGTYVLTAGVTSKELSVLNLTEAPLSQPAASEGRRFLQDTFDGRGDHSYKQLVGRTFFGSNVAGEVLYGVTANFAKPGGIDVWDLSTDPRRPVLVGSSISYETGSANRVVLAKAGKCTFAAVPLEDEHSFAIFDVTLPQNPKLIRRSARVKNPTYALEVIRGADGTRRILLFDEVGQIYFTDVVLSCAS